jgi:hypothetical protein
MSTVSTTKVVASPKVAAYIREHGGEVWVWLDPHRCLVGSYIQLETHTEPPGTSRKTRITRSARRPHRFRDVPADGFTVHFDHGRMDPPEELHFDLKGLRTKRVEAYWNGCVFAGDDVTPPSASN